LPISYCTEAVALADVAGLADMRAFAECCLTHVYVVAGKLREAVKTGERAVAYFESHGNVWWACRTLWGLSMACNAIGEWERSLSFCRRGFEYGQEVNDLRLKVVGLWRTGSTHIQRGDAEVGVRYCDEALALSPIPFDAATARALKGYGLAKMGRTAEGIAVLESVAAWLDQQRLPYTRCVIGLDLAESYLRNGDVSQAQTATQIALQTSRELGYRHLEGWAERILGECRSGEDGGEAHLARAASILEEAGARNEFAKTLVAQAEMQLRRENWSAARELAERALKIFEALRTLDGPERARRLMAEVARSRATGQ